MARRREVEGSALKGTNGGQKTLPVSSLAHNPRNPRDDYSDIGELALGIKSVGVLTPLGVARYEVYLTHFPEYEHEIAGFDWVVINGNRRLAAARMLDLAEVPVTEVEHLGRDGKFDEGVLIDNIHHEKLPLLREALALKELVDRHGKQAIVAERLGKTPAYISQRLGLLRLVDELQEEVRAKRLAFEDARTLSTLPKEEQLTQWKRLRDLQEQADDVDAGRTLWSQEKQAETSPVETAIKRPGRPRVRTVKIGEPGEIATQLREYLAPEDLEALIKILSAPQ